MLRDLQVPEAVLLGKLFGGFKAICRYIIKEPLTALRDPSSSRQTPDSCKAAQTNGSVVEPCVVRQISTSSALRVPALPSMYMGGTSIIQVWNTLPYECLWS
jgi:hypothetical protein